MRGVWRMVEETVDKLQDVDSEIGLCEDTRSSGRPFTTCRLSDHGKKERGQVSYRSVPHQLDGEKEAATKLTCEGRPVPTSNNPAEVKETIRSRGRGFSF